jgi:glucose dehydrogenase
MPGTYDGDTNTIYWGTANPAPLYDWGGADWMHTGARPGTNLYTTSVIGLDADTGKLKFYHQELPHDGWDFDSAVGEFVMLDHDGQKTIVHPNKGGFVFVYDRDLKVQNVYPVVNAINVKDDRSMAARTIVRHGGHAPVPGCVLMARRSRPAAPLSRRPAECSHRPVTIRNHSEAVV